MYNYICAASSVKAYARVFEEVNKMESMVALFSFRLPTIALKLQNTRYNLYEAT